ncbi:putative D-serine dehydratase [Dirofilaria immitis]|nr:hypothetical protein [Dirofilaria immitis]
MKIALFAYIAALSFAQSSSLLLKQKEKLGSTVNLQLGKGVLDVKVEVLKNDDKSNSKEMEFQSRSLELNDYEKNYKYILQNGKITNYGRERYGDRLSFENGILKIKDLTVNDAVTYFYFLHGDKKNPAAIDVELE